MKLGGLRAMQRACAAVATVAAMLATVPAEAVTRLSFSGVVDSLSAGYAIPGIDVGDAITGSLLYDPTVADGQPLNWIGYYPGAISGFSATIGALSFTQYTAQSPNSEIDVINDDFSAGLYRDSLYFRVAVAEAATPDVVRFLQLSFSVAGTTQPGVLVDDSIPADFDPLAFSLRRGFITVLPPGVSQGSNFALNSVAVAPVPEPRMSLLMLAGLSLLWLGAGLHERRRRPAASSPTRPG
nr:hypothetical protein [Methyloversatilis discipulorum]